jgi:hypothetical protein
MGRSRAKTETNALGHCSANTSTENGGFTPWSSPETHKLAGPVLEGTDGERAGTGVKRLWGVLVQRLRVEFFA